MPTTRESPQSPESLEASAEAHEQAARDSFDRCDTDGFLTQYAHGVLAQRDRIAAQIARDGGKAEFWGLFDAATGERLPAALFKTRFGDRWAVFAADGKNVVEWLPVAYGEGTSRKLKKRGLVEKHEMAPAEAVIEGTGTGLSGRAWAAKRRTDGGYPGRPGYTTPTKTA